MADVVMPRLSDSMEEGTILQWMKQVGEEVAVGEELVEIETDKANMAYESDVAGTLTEILAQEGETLPIGSVIAKVGDSDRAPAAASAGPVAAGDPPPPPVAKASSGAGPPATPPAEQAGETTPGAPAPQANAPAAEALSAREDDGRPKASPLARRLAKERGVEMCAIEGSGPAAGS